MPPGTPFSSPAGRDITADRPTTSGSNGAAQGRRDTVARRRTEEAPVSPTRLSASSRQNGSSSITTEKRRSIPRWIVARGLVLAVCSLFSFLNAAAAMSTDVARVDGIVDGLRIEASLEFDHSCTVLREEGNACEPNLPCREYTFCAKRSTIACSALRDRVIWSFYIGILGALTKVPCAVLGVLDVIGKLPCKTATCNSRLLIGIAAASVVVQAVWLGLVFDLLLGVHCGSDIALKRNIYGLGSKTGPAVYLACASATLSAVSLIVVTILTCCCAGGENIEEPEPADERDVLDFIEFAD